MSDCRDHRCGHCAARRAGVDVLEHYGSLLSRSAGWLHLSVDHRVWHRVNNCELSIRVRGSLSLFFFLNVGVIISGASSDRSVCSPMASSTTVSCSSSWSASSRRWSSGRSKRSSRWSSSSTSISRSSSRARETSLPRRRSTTCPGSSSASCSTTSSVGATLAGGPSTTVSRKKKRLLCLLDILGTLTRRFRVLRRCPVRWFGRGLRGGPPPHLLHAAIPEKWHDRPEHRSTMVGQYRLYQDGGLYGGTIQDCFGRRDVWSVELVKGRKMDWCPQGYICCISFWPFLTAGFPHSHLV